MPWRWGWDLDRAVWVRVLVFRVGLRCVSCGSALCVLNPRCVCWAPFFYLSSSYFLPCSSFLSTLFLFSFDVLRSALGVESSFPAFSLVLLFRWSGCFVGECYECRFGDASTRRRRGLERGRTRTRIAAGTTDGVRGCVESRVYVLTAALLLGGIRILPSGWRGAHASLGHVRRMRLVGGMHVSFTMVGSPRFSYFDFDTAACLSLMARW